MWFGEFALAHIHRNKLPYQLRICLFTMKNSFPKAAIFFKKNEDKSWILFWIFNHIFILQHCWRRSNFQRCGGIEHDWKWVCVDCYRTSSFISKCSKWHFRFGISGSCQWGRPHQWFFVSHALFDLISSTKSKVTFFRSF